jgi:hypothetical protein
MLLGFNIYIHSNAIEPYLILSVKIGDFKILSRHRDRQFEFDSSNC